MSELLSPSPASLVPNAASPRAIEAATLDDLAARVAADAHPDAIGVAEETASALFLIVYAPDGTGKVVLCQNPPYRVILPHDEAETFAHDLVLDALRQEHGDDPSALEETLREHFWTEINPQLEDPFLLEGELTDVELDFLDGSQEELDRLMRLFLLTEPGLENASDETVVLCAETDETDAGLDDVGYVSPRLAALVALALQEHRPYGWTWEYNDGPFGQRSGYTKYPQMLEYQLDEIVEAPAREKMAARAELRRWLRARGEDPAAYGLPEAACIS